MAERLPPVPEDGFRDEDRFEAWLKSLPEDRINQVAQVLSCRAALRVLPNLSLAFSKGKAAQETICDLTLATLRANSISRVALKYTTREIASAAHSALSVALSALSAALSAHSAALSARSAALSARSAAHSAGSADSAFSAALSARSAALSADSAHSAALSADSAAHSAGSAAHSATWKAIANDSRTVAEGSTALDLLVRPLWLEDDPPKWWQESRQRFRARLELLDQEAERDAGEPGSWFRWVQWYNAIAQGRSPWGLPMETAWELEKRIALSDGRGEDFWKRNPEVINREIAKWVDEARRKVREEDQETTFDLNSIAPPEQIENATQLAVNDDGKIDLARPAPENRLLDTQSQRQEYFAARSDALAMQDAGSNRLGKLLPELEKLLRAMPEDFAAATVFDLWRAINRLRRTSNAHRALGPDEDGHEAKLEPSVAEELDHLLDQLNILAFNDPNLRERDNNRIPPQDRATNEAARELMEPLVEDVIQNEDLTTETAAKTVEADIASASDADITEHGAQAVDQAVKTERNTLAAYFSSLHQKLKTVIAGEAGFAWKDFRAGIYRGAGATFGAFATAELTGFSTVVKSTIAYTLENAPALKEVALQIFQNPRLAEMIDWIVRIFP